MAVLSIILNSVTLNSQASCNRFGLISPKDQLSDEYNCSFLNFPIVSVFFFFSSYFSNPAYNWSPLRCHVGTGLVLSLNDED